MLTEILKNVSNGTQGFFTINKVMIILFALITIWLLTQYSGDKFTSVDAMETGTDASVGAGLARACIRAAVVPQWADMVKSQRLRSLAAIVERAARRNERRRAAGMRSGSHAAARVGRCAQSAGGAAGDRRSVDSA